MLGRSPNTTPSLYHSAVFDVMAYDWRWFTRVCLVEGQDGSGRVPSPVRCVDHALPCLLVISILLHYLLHPDTKPSSCDAMVIIVLQEIPHHNIHSCSNACNWTSCDKMPSMATFLAVLS